MHRENGSVNKGELRDFHNACLLSPIARIKHGKLNNSRHFDSKLSDNRP